MKKKLLSYLYPITQKVETNNNGIVEITYDQGKKVLDSANANYSYGSLQKILKFGLQQIDLDHTRHILLLGLGGGSVIKTLRSEFKYNHKITAVEIDDIIIQIAFKEFNIKPNENLELLNDNALFYVRKAKQKYDLIIIDLFIDNAVPKDFYEPDFWNNIYHITSKGGSILFNASTIEHVQHEIEKLLPTLNSLYFLQQMNKVEGSNTLILGTKKSESY
jgi:spermidine synthase